LLFVALTEPGPAAAESLRFPDAMLVVTWMLLLVLLLLLLQHGRARALPTAVQPAAQTVTWCTYLSSPAVLCPLL
jgi:hypothetical protein